MALQQRSQLHSIVRSSTARPIHVLHVALSRVEAEQTPDRSESQEFRQLADVAEDEADRASSEAEFVHEVHFAQAIFVPCSLHECAFLRAHARHAHIQIRTRMTACIHM